MVIYMHGLFLIVEHSYCFILVIQGEKAYIMLNFLDKKQQYNSAPPLPIEKGAWGVLGHGFKSP